MIKVLSSDEQKTNKEEEETNQYTDIQCMTI